MSIRTAPTLEQNHPVADGSAAPRSLPASVVVAGSLLSGAMTAFVLTTVVFAGGTESQLTGSLLLASAFGWALMAALSAGLTRQPQRWAAVPALAFGAAGLAILTASPGDTALTALNWVWPPVVTVLAAWSFARMRRSLTGGGRLLLTPVLLLLVATAVGATVQNVSSQTTYAAPGTTYDVGGHRLHMFCSGHGHPTVVLFNGLGEISAAWTRVIGEVGPHARVCAYDRAGQGWSDDAGSPQDGREAAGDLHALLHQAGEKGPLVLVGHSTGGTYALTYAARYPEQVSGMVLLDGSSPEQFARMPRYPRQYAVMRRGVALLPTVARLGVTRLFAASDLPGADGERVRAMTSTPHAQRNSRDEVSMIPRVFQQAQALTSLHGRPLVVLTASESMGTEGWLAAQDALAALSDNHLHRVVESTHAGLVDNARGAHASVRAIAEVVTAVRTGTPLTTPG